MNDETPRNFLVVELGDNDFRYQIVSALEELKNYWAEQGNIQYYCPQSIKNYIIAWLVSYDWKQRALNGDWKDKNSASYVGPDISSIKYFQHLRVTFREKLPTYDPYDETTVKDDDGGSAAMDLHTGYVFSF